MVRLVSWNMAHRVAAWAALRDVGADVRNGQRNSFQGPRKVSSIAGTGRGGSAARRSSASAAGPTRWRPGLPSRHHIYGVGTHSFLIRMSDSSVPAGHIGVLDNVERLMDAGAEVEGVHESVPVLSSQPANSSIPTSLDSDKCQARSRRVGRSSPDLQGRGRPT